MLFFSINPLNSILLVVILTLFKSGSVIVNINGSNIITPPIIATVPIKTNLRLLKNILLSILSVN